jgi:DNA-binding CsgD family transcriptional regulator
MRDAERVDAVPRLVCPACGGPVDLDSATDGQTVCADCRRELDLRALAEELVTLTRLPVPVVVNGSGGPWLSAVERELLALLLQGYRVNQIATRLDVTVPTVRKRVRRLLAKTGTSSQAELIAAYRSR